MDEQITRRDQVAGRQFAILSTRLEDATLLSFKGHRGNLAERIQVANQLIDIAQEATAVSEVLILMLQDGLFDQTET